jgi:hypothetical protein
VLAEACSTPALRSPAPRSRVAGRRARVLENAARGGRRRARVRRGGCLGRAVVAHMQTLAPCQAAQRPTSQGSASPHVL